MKKINDLIGKKQLEDYGRILSYQLALDDLKQKTVFVTGGTGMIGGALIKLLLYMNQVEDCQIHVVCMARNLEKVRRYYGDLLEREDLEIVLGEARERICYEGSVDYVFHCASVTTSKTMVEHPIQTLDISYCGTKNILEFAAEKKVKSFVYLSSMEAYGIMKEDRITTEKDLGYIDLQSVRSSYSEGKRMCECLCTAYYKEKQVPVRIARLAQTFGAGVLDSDRRVYAQFAKSVIEGTDIVLHSDGESEGNYCYLSEALEGLLRICIQGEDGEIYNVVNESMHMKIREMAQIVASQVAGDAIAVRYDIPEDVEKMGYAPKVKIKLSGEKLRQTGWCPQIGMKEAYERMIHDLKNSPIEGA